MQIKLLVTIVFLITGTIPLYSQLKLDNAFYVQNTLNGFNNAPKTAAEKANLVKTIGFDGLEGMGYEDFFELKNALDKEDLKMPVNYVELDFETEGRPDSIRSGEIKTMIKASERGSVIYFHLHSKTYLNDKSNGDNAIAAYLRELCEYSAPFGIKLCIYPHIGTYCETVSHSIQLAKIVDRKNFGAAMNLCHLLKVEGSEGIGSKIKEFAPLLFAVNICGADDGDTKQYGWDRLIQPLGQGSFDTYGFIKLLRDNGYNGPFGLQCYNLKGDAAEILTSSLKAWKDYKKRYSEEKKF